MFSISGWLQSIGLEQYTQVFEANDISEDLIAQLDHDLLKEIGITSVGHRLRLINAVADLTNASCADLTAPPTTTDQRRPDSSVASPIASTQTTAEAERRQLTVMFCDLVGSTALSAQYDPEEFSDIVRFFQDCCAGIITRYEGHIARYMGDGILVYFGYPIAHEDDGERAIRAGLQIIESVSQLQPRPALILRTRIGVATGLVVVGETVGSGSAQEQVVMGETPNLAARLQQIAAPDQLVISTRTREHVGDAFEYDNLGTHELKGFDKPITALRVSAERIIESRYDALRSGQRVAIVGRDKEISQIMHQWQQAQQGQGRLVLLTGEAGVGKSRLNQAIFDNLKDIKYNRLSLQCSPYHEDVALYPVVQYLRRTAGIKTSDDNRVQSERLQTMLDTHETLVEDDRTLIKSLILGDAITSNSSVQAMSAPVKRLHSMHAVCKLIVGLSQHLPVLFIVEDAHWIDPTTQELLDENLKDLLQARILVLITARPSYQHNYGYADHLHQISLNRLDNSQAVEIIKEVAGGKPLPEDVIRDIVAKTDGVPLFVEELTKSVLESGLLRDAGDSWELAGESNEYTIPSSLHDSLMARLDRLGSAKEYAQIGAVIGRDFSFSLLAELTEHAEETVDLALEKLIQAGLISRRGLPPETVHSFKHALIRDTAYESLLHSRRRHWHARIANVLEQRTSGHTDTEPSLLAQHYTDAGMYDDALRYRLIAAERRLTKFDNQEARIEAHQGLKLLGANEALNEHQESELKLQVIRGLASRSIDGFTAVESEEAFRRAMHLSRELGEFTQHLASLRGLFSVLYVRGQYSQALELGRKVIDEFSEDKHQMEARLLVGQVLYSLGEFNRAHESMDYALKLITPITLNTAISKQFDLRCGALQFLQRTHLMLGRPERALITSQEAVDLAQELSQPFAIAATLIGHCTLHSRLGLPFSEHSAKLTELTQRHRMEYWKAWAKFCASLVDIQESRFDDAIVKIDESLEQHQLTNSRMGLTHLLLSKAQVYLQRKQPADALASLDLSENIAEETGERCDEANFLRLHAAVLMQQRPTDMQGAVDHLRRAIEVARGQSCLWWELIASIDLARLRQQNGDRNEAYALLSPVYAKFNANDRFATLNECRTLLGELES